MRYRWHGLLAVLLTAAAPAQSVRIEAREAFSGFVRCTVDKAPPHPVGVCTAPDGATTLYVTGRATGLDTQIVDVRVSLDAGERLTLDLAKSLPSTHALRLPPGDLLAWLGGLPALNGAPMGYLGLREDGAALLSHWRCRTGRMFVVDLWLWWVPGQAWVQGEAMVTASNPWVPDLLEQVPTGFELTFGDAVVSVPGRSNGSPLIDGGTAFADGQARILPLTFVWERHGAKPGEVHAIGISRLWNDGNPMLPAGHSVAQWADGKREASIARLHSWLPAVYGPNANSADTGAQSDQVFIGMQGMQEPRAAFVLYLNALKLANKPHHYREDTGAPLNLAAHPNLRMWDARPDSRISTDMLGKPRGLASWDVPGGMWGPDVEHNFANVLAVSARLTGSPACQQLLTDWATLYPLQWRNNPWPSRAVGWECLMAQHLWRELENRPLAVATRDHHLWRLHNVILPAWGTKDVRDIRTDDQRLGPGAWTMDWQNSIEAWFLDRSGVMFDVPAARVVALRAAKHTLANAWVQEGTRWKSRATRPIAGGGVADEDFNHFGMPLSIATVLAHEPENPIARSVWAQLVADATTEKAAAWMPQEVWK